jgi:hypothetical protein
VVEVLCYNPEGRWFMTRLDELYFSIYLILPSALGTGFTQPLKEIITGSKKIMFLKSRARPVRKVASVSQLSIQCGILNISQPYRPPQPVTGIALLYGDGVCFL